MKYYSGKTSTAIIPYPDNKILLIKRSTPPFIGYWALPGGQMDTDESIEQTVIREVKEETGLDTIVVNVLGEYIEKGVKDNVEYEYYPTCFVVRVIGGKLRKQDSEVKEIQLFSLNDLPTPLACEHEKMIEDYEIHKKQKMQSIV
jgi:8-oxo-dGTP diphosphatase